MYSFRNDYSEGACDEIMSAFITSNRKQSVGYGLDPYCEEARELIQKRCQAPNSDVHFFVGGTQANQTIIASILRPYEAVIAVDSGHINTHETGAIEASGHKVLTTPAVNGKLLPEDVERIVKQHTDEHMVKPAMVYISNATEIGTVYSKAEIKALRDVCDKYHLYFFMDGARLGAALASEGCDMKLEDFAQYLDVFYIGGTKNGCLFGEACVIVKDELKENFRYHIKQRGGMLAKGRMLGIQFKELMSKTIFLDLAKHANECAQRMQAGMKKEGIKFFVETPTNQIFPILDHTLIEQLSKKYAFQVWEEVDETHTAMRFVTSWATPFEVIDEFLSDLHNLINS